MIKLIEARSFRCLRYIRQPLQSFNVLVGPNASGKTTFLNTIAFLGRLVSDGPDAAISDWTENFRDLVFGREENYFELAIEVKIPEPRRQNLRKAFNLIRYEVRVGRDEDRNEVGILAEKAWLKTDSSLDEYQPKLQFPSEPIVPNSIISSSVSYGQTILSKAHHGNDNFYREVREAGGGKGWIPSFRFGPKKSALGNIPEDESKFPAATWLKSFLAEGVQNIILNSMSIKKASPPGQGRRFKADGSNLPWVINDLRKNNLNRFKEWIYHIRTALPDIEDIKTIERRDDKHRYIVIRFRTGLEVPSWVASDGTLRLLALTIPAYLINFEGAYLIEEPENGIHPSAVDTVYQSLSSVYDAQIFLATHSPVILSMSSPDNVLCFRKTKSGATDIVRGSNHPALRDWTGQPNLSVIFASGVL